MLQKRKTPKELECHVSALTAYQPEKRQKFPRKSELSELETFNLYRDYMKHEDSLITSRLGTFLSMNSFMIGASILILGGVLQTFLKTSSDSKPALLVIMLGIIVHSVIATVGWISADLTATSIQAATNSLSFLRDRGHHRLQHAIRRGDLPYLTNGRGLSKDERDDLDSGQRIMRDIPGIMRYLWTVVGVIPLLLLPMVVPGLLGMAHWEAPPPPEAGRITIQAPAQQPATPSIEAAPEAPHPTPTKPAGQPGR